MSPGEYTHFQSARWSYAAPSFCTSEIATPRGFLKGSGKTWPCADCQPWREDLLILQVSPAIAYPYAKGPGAHLCGRCGGVHRRALHQPCTWDHQGGGPVQYQSLSRSGQSSHSSFASAGICNLGGLSCAAHGAFRPPPRMAASRFHSASCRKHSRARMAMEFQACQGPRQCQHIRCCLESDSRSTG